MHQSQERDFPSAEHRAYASFVRRAPDILDFEELALLFARALREEGVTGHLCCTRDGAGGLMPLLGDDPSLAGRRRQPASLSLLVEAPDGSKILVLFGGAALAGSAASPRLALLATIYLTQALVLAELRDEPAWSDALSGAERQCLALYIAGLSYLDIGERGGFSAPAVGLLLRRAAVKLGCTQIEDAADIAVKRKLLIGSIS